MLVSPLYSMQIYDRVLASRNLETLALLTLIVVAFLALYGLLEYARSGVLVQTSVAFEDRLRRPLFDAMLRAELSPRNRPGQQVIRDAEILRESLASGLASTLCDLPWLPVYLLVCYVLHPVLGVIATAGAAALFVVAFVTEQMTRSNVLENTKLAHEAHGLAASALRNGEAVRGLGMGDSVLDRWCGVQSAANAHAAAAQETSATMHALSKFARVAIQTGLLCAGAWLAIQGQLSPGAMLASSIVMGRALAPIEQIVSQWKRIIACRASYARLRELFTAFPQGPRPIELPTPEGRIEVENAVVWPPHSQRPAVKYVSFTVEPGECVGIIGASGSGKSSLARALTGVWPLADGSVRIDGAAQTQWDANKLGKHIGYLPQQVDLFSGTIAENIARLGAIEQEKVIAAARAAGAHEAILRMPRGYETPIGDGGLALAGGMRQRVGLARALYGDPRLIVLDEPDSNLDDDGEKALAQAVLGLKKAGRTVLIITHRSSVLAIVDKILVMSLGQALAFGEKASVLAKIRGNRVAVVKGNATKPVAVSA
jgi:ATP-binding cassette subfamily C protein/ATP-binding cassette subfamily C protein EexD